jgi:hypothetical protein
MGKRVAQRRWRISASFARGRRDTRARDSPGFSNRSGGDLGIAVGCGRMSSWSCLSLLDAARAGTHLFRLPICPAATRILAQQPRTVTGHKRPVASVLQRRKQVPAFHRTGLAHRSTGWAQSPRRPSAFRRCERRSGAQVPARG